MNPRLDDLMGRLRRQKFLSLALVIFTLALGIVVGTLITYGVKARDQVVAPGATPLAIPTPAQLSSAFVQIANSVSPSVVNINTSATVRPPTARRRQQQPRERGQDPFEDFFDRFFEFGPAPREGLRQRSLGSGVIVDKNGYILTNRHVVEQADRIQVKIMGDPERYDAKVIGSDVETDLAVLKIEVKKDLIPAKIGNSDGIRVGDWVLAIGSPFGLEETVTAGIISAKSRDIPGARQFQHFLQTDAAINPGNSGGPLVNMAGEVIGVNTAIITQRGTYEGVGFALPSNQAVYVYNQLIKTGHVSRGSIGVEFQQESEQTPALLRTFGVDHGIVINSVRPDSPAAKAGLKSGDVIVAVNGAPIKTGNDLVSIISETPVGSQVKIQYVRNGKKQDTTVTVAERSELFGDILGEAEERPSGGEPEDVKFGMTLQQVTPEMASRLGLEPARGVAVAEIDPGSFAEDIGLQRGDIITEIQQKPVNSVDDVRRAQRDMKSGEDIVFKVLRRDPRTRGYSPLFLAGTLP